MNKPDITWIGSPNFWEGRRGEKAIAITEHIMAGTLRGCDSWFQQTTDRDKCVSAHFGVGVNGEIHQYVKIEDAAWANGILQQPDQSIPWLAECSARGINPNLRTISIEHEGYSGRPLTETQYGATLSLHLWLVEAYRIPVDNLHIIGHNRITGIDRAGCPGAAFPWDRLFHDLGGTAKERINGTPNPGGWRDPVNGFWVVPPISKFYCQQGNLAVFGRPISGMTGDDTRFPGLIVQDFERVRLEIHPDGTIMVGRSNTELVALSQGVGKNGIS